MNLKVGVMPGRLVEVIVEEGTTVREIFGIAGIEISNHEIRLDGEKIELNNVINEGRLLVAMKMIKGNAEIKVGVMPGKLVSVELHEGDRAHDVFERAGIEVSNHEIRLDGDKINIDTAINNGNLLVAMKMIKGNLGRYVTNCTEQEVYHITGLALDTVIDESDVDELDDMLLIKNEYLIDRDTFLSIYVLDGDEEMDIENELLDIKEVEEDTCDCTHVKALDVLKAELQDAKETVELYRSQARRYEERMMYLEELIYKIEN